MEISAGSSTLGIGGSITHFGGGGDAVAGCDAVSKDSANGGSSGCDAVSKDSNLEEGISTVSFRKGGTCSIPYSGIKVKDIISKERHRVK